jgi:hypothetical protein
MAIRLLRILGGIIFFLVATMKGHMIITEWSNLHTPDPVFLVVSSRFLISFAIIAECAMAVVLCLAPKHIAIGRWMLGLCITIGYYRFARWTLGIKAPCSCLGNWLREWGVSNRQAEEAAIWILAALALLGGALAILESRIALTSPEKQA